MQKAVQDICIKYGISASSRQPRPATVTKEAAAVVDAFEGRPMRLLLQLKFKETGALLRHCCGTVYGANAQRWRRQLIAIWIKVSLL